MDYSNHKLHQINCDSYQKIGEELNQIHQKIEEESNQILVQSENRKKKIITDIFEAEFKRLENSSLPEEVKRSYREKLIEMMYKKME